MTPRPLLVLAVALLLTGMGQVLNREPARGLVFAFFALLLGAATMATAPPEASRVGQLSGGLFVHAMAALDAYRRARLRSERGPEREAGRVTAAGRRSPPGSAREG